jgi:hypothetical protein
VHSPTGLVQAACLGGAPADQQRRRLVQAARHSTGHGVGGLPRPLQAQGHWRDPHGLNANLSSPRRSAARCGRSSRSTPRYPRPRPTGSPQTVVVDLDNSIICASHRPSLCFQRSVRSLITRSGPRSSTSFSPTVGGDITQARLERPNHPGVMTKRQHLPPPAAAAALHVAYRLFQPVSERKPPAAAAMSSPNDVAPPVWSNPRAGSRRPDDGRHGKSHTGSCVLRTAGDRPSGVETNRPTPTSSSPGARRSAPSPTS